MPEVSDPIARQRPSRMPYRRYRSYHSMLPVDLPDRTWPTRQIDDGAALVRGRPARRQPGADRPDVPRAEAADVPAAGAHGLQGDRGRLPRRQPDRLRVRPAAHRAGHDPRRRDDPGPHPVPGAPDRPHFRVTTRRQAGDRPLLQLHLGAPAAGRVRAGQGGDHRDRHRRRADVPEVRRDPHSGHRDLLPVLAGVVHRHRAGVRPGHLRRGDGCDPTRPRTAR